MSDEVRAGRNAALLRAGVAVAGAVALLVGVLLMDDARPPTPAPAEPAPAASVLQAAPPSPTPAPAVEPATPEPAVAEQAAQAGEAAAPATVTVPASAPAVVLVPPVAPQAPTPAAAVAPVVSMPVAPVAETAPAPVPAQATALAALANQPTAPMKEGYLLQLGVFGNPVNAGALQAELAAKGLPARVESRVVLGPFPDRKALDAAQRRLRREHGRDAIVVPPRSAR